MELQPATNFSMLTEYLHILFKHYIINGRMRAPPEFDLRDMIPTFQPGAKTNRRALQSKFKSWAKRMEVLNDNLVLASSGKIIIPQERCEEIIMRLHCDNHLGIDKIITQIQRNYTWTKKNFGMDLEIVMNAISKNCKNAACKKDLGKAIKTYCRKLFQGFPVSAVPRPFYSDSNIEGSEFFDYPMEIPPRDAIFPMEYPILQGYLSNGYNSFEILPERFKNRTTLLTKIDNKECKNIVSSKTKNFLELNLDMYRKCNNTQSITSIENQMNETGAIRSTPFSGDNQCFSKSLDTGNKSESETVRASSTLSLPSAAICKNNYSFSMEDDESNQNSHSLKRSCKKPKNLNEFKKQLKVAQLYPEIYPAIFSDPKSQFLSTLGLVPKRICSKKILTKFTKEQRKKRLIEKRRSWFVVERKVLRDRNKLNKRNSLRLRFKNEAQGNVSRTESFSFHHSSIQNSQKRRSNFKKLKNIAKRPLRGYNEKPRIIKPQLIFPREPIETTKKDPEVIDIASSEDESSASHSFRNVKTEISEPNFQSASATTLNGSSQYADPRLFGCNVENEDAVRNQMFYEQNFGYNGVFGAPNIYLGHNSAVNFPITSNNQSYQHNDSFYVNSQSQFPIMRPFLIPATSNRDIAVLQAGNFPIIRPLRPISSPKVSPYFKDALLLPENTNSLRGESGNLADDKQSLSNSNDNVVSGNKESSTNINPEQLNQPSHKPTNLKVFLVNKAPKKAYLLVPPNYKTYLNTAKKIFPTSDRKQPIAPRITYSKKLPLKYKMTVAKDLQQRRLNNAMFENVSYSYKQKETKKNIQSEMSRLSNWISVVKSSVTPTAFQRGVEKFSHRLTNQLNIGITLVKSARKALTEIEKNE